MLLTLPDNSVPAGGTPEAVASVSRMASAVSRVCASQTGELQSALHRRLSDLTSGASVWTWAGTSPIIALQTGLNNYTDENSPPTMYAAKRTKDAKNLTGDCNGHCRRGSPGRLKVEHAVATGRSPCSTTARPGRRRSNSARLTVLKFG